jgi:putative transposase
MAGDRRSIRLKGYDYSTPGAYFITICTHSRKPILGSSHVRRAVEDAWTSLPGRFDNVELDEFAAMPEHVHFVVWLIEPEPCRGGHLAAQGGRTPAPTLANVVGTFKTVSAKAINRIRDSVGESVWQRNYFEHIVRGDRELERIRDYICSHPVSEQDHRAQALPYIWKRRA